VHHSPRRPDYWQDPVDLYSALNVAPDPWVLAGVVSEPQDPTLLKLSLTNEAPTVEVPPEYLWPFQAESGQLIIDKERHWDVLEYLLFLNTHDSFTYSNAMGDKDTFRVAFSMAGKSKDYWQCPFAPSIPLHDTHEEGVRYCSLGMLQVHPITGNPLFHHRTSEAKLELRRKGRKCVGPITHVTPSITRPQAGVMMWRNVEANLYGGPNTKYQWGLRSDQVHEFTCGTESQVKVANSSLTTENYHKYGDEWCACRAEGLHVADLQCANRTLKEQYYNALPISVIQVPKAAPLYKISLAEVEAVEVMLYAD